MQQTVSTQPKTLGSFDISKNRKILIQGDSGSGKTVFAAGFPTPLYVADFDGKISSAAAFYANQPERLAKIDYDSFPNATREARPFASFYTRLQQHRQLVGSGTFPYKTYVIDSLTTLVDSLMQEIMTSMPSNKRMSAGTVQVPMLSDYNVLSGYFKQTLNQILSLPCNVIVTAHVQLNKDEMTGEIFREPLLPGKLAKFLPVVFEEVYRAFTIQKDGQTGYFAQTQSANGYTCRSQIKNLPNPLLLSHEEFKKHGG